MWTLAPSLQVLLLLSVACGEYEADLVYVRWFNASGDGWNRSLNLRPLVWFRYVWRSGQPAASFGCIPLETVLQRVCIVRVPPKGKGAQAPSASGKGGKSRRVATGNSKDDLIPVVSEEVMDEVRPRKDLQPSAAREELTKHSWFK
ncbi:hypothetical protein VOLCADRAFT_107388 [Volvox carteri f. nagariensis]|uniref:Secreted protein n=1 Tax=Volvox carteri f. nagariensis TaxID=3068 RepID=D8UDP1_VOLCA|nr:uncharacterized protein VOLCADRAFT_107388 [Volvox carteri f. nagariensis]EFJ42076.1 hypothetical protein VOLCADRAFT_107388 [Volvox carteri f. nagariensis]|eukprot:XP_002956773.1 hypothetical protein VOLCADRAFT_107388 [Volvox carteri f. nagariensis]